MSTIDFLLIIVVIAATIYGYCKGILSQMGALAGVLIGILCCRLFADDVAAYFNSYFVDSTSTKSSSMFLNNIIAYIVVFLAAYFGAKLISKLLTTIFAKVKLGVVNRFAGVVFAVVQALVLLSLGLNLWIALFPESELVTSKKGYADERLVNLAPDILGSDMAKDIINATKDLSKKEELKK